MSALDGIEVRRTTTAQQLADGLSERILAGAFGPGDRLRESAIAAELGVARNTIREAVRILELTGLVRYEVNRGAVVIAPTPENVEALYTARERLETAAALARRPPSSSKRSRGVRRARRDARNRRRPPIVDRDLAFHQAIVAMLDSSRLDEFFAALTKELRFYLTVLTSRTARTRTRTRSVSSTRSSSTPSAPATPIGRSPRSAPTSTATPFG